MLMFVLTVLSSVAGAANAPPISQLPSGEIVFRDYPERARAAGEQGVIEFRIRADSTGIPITCQVTGSSGHPSLDEETCHLLRHYAYFQPVGQNPSKVVHQGRVRWKLPVLTAQVATQTVSPRAQAPAAKSAAPSASSIAASAAASAAPARAEGAKTGKLICKRVPRVDTLTGTEKVCRRVQSDKSSD